METTIVLLPIYFTNVTGVMSLTLSFSFM